jgi:hypothetical protein
MRAARERKRRAGFRLHQGWVDVAPRGYSDQQRLDARSLAMHCLVARKLLAKQLEHLLRASASILINSGSRSSTQELVVIGSQAILVQYPQAPGELLRSMEADLYPLREPKLADAIDGAIGELSAFHDTYGYYAQGVGPETATLPAKWIDRVIPVQSEATGQAVGLCLEAHDLAISKYVAGREKDLSFTFDAKIVALRFPRFSACISVRSEHSNGTDSHPHNADI